MRLKPAVYIERRAFLFEQLDANPKASYASLQRALKEKFKHAMQQKILKAVREDWRKDRPHEVSVYRSVPAGSDNFVLDQEMTAAANRLHADLRKVVLPEDPSDEAMRRIIASEPKQFTEEDLKPAPQDFEF